jgi:uncharacterized membrane protein
MIRKFFSSGHAERGGVDNKRNYEIKRIETFSDGVFAFALTLLIVSLEVPQNFDELVTKMRGFFVFGICFLVLVSIWYNQHLFFRRYGMDDFWTVVLNGFLLFIVLFYIYPLKFLFTLFLGNSSTISITREQVPQLMMIYAGGFIIIYFIFLLLYLRAYRKSRSLGLTPVETFDCKTIIYKESIMILIGLCSFFISAASHDESAGDAGYIYVLIWPLINILFYFRKKSRRKLFPGITK